MTSIDWPMLINWIVSGLIGLLFGVIGGYVTYRLERNRDDVRWERERANLEQQFKHDREQMELVWQQKLQELQIQFMREDQKKLRDDIMVVLQDPLKIIQNAGLYNRLANDAVYGKQMMRMMVECEVLFRDINPNILPEHNRRLYVEVKKQLEFLLERALLESPDTTKQLDEGEKQTS
jgi:hypothetical protein